MAKRLRRTLETAAIPVIAVLLGLVVSSVFVLFAHTDPADPQSPPASPIQTYQTMFCEGFGPKGCQTFGDLFFIRVQSDSGDTQTYFSLTYGVNGHQLAQVLERATILILTALSATVAFQAGMFSIGMDGQLVLGAIVAAFLGYWLPNQVYATFHTDPKTASDLLLTVMHLVVPAVCIAAAMLIGAFYSWIAGYLKVKLNVNELISTIILNAIAVEIVGYLVRFPLRADANNIARTKRIDDTAWLIPFNRALFKGVEWFSNSRTGIGIIIALMAAALIAIYLWRSTYGYEQRMSRGSGLFARFGGIPNQQAALRAMLISGALSGLAGSIQILGVERQVVDGFAGAGIGFDGVLVAILARESIPGILLVAVFFAGLELGATNLQYSNLPRELGGIIIAFIILFSSMEDFFRTTIAHIQARFRPHKPTEIAETQGSSP